ncbi:MAG TPA: redox-sensing transcriptional repressor Rex [Candidatus Hydrogenedentes bacterium]|nr:redox-sensing transcriptional repressor Rex [Candidatus Hydrogenedentota bacterium]
MTDAAGGGWQKGNSAVTSPKTVGRLSLYRRLLYTLQSEGEQNVFSHQLAAMARGTAAQVRRDLMAIGFSGSPSKGYDIQGLVESIGEFLDGPTRQNAALVGAGNLGKAILTYFKGRRPKLAIVAAFDSDPRKTNRAIRGCPCYPIEDLARVVRNEDICTGIITVPATQAQHVADLLCRAGVRGLVNFAPVRLGTPAGVYVEDIDVTMVLEKAAYFARQTPE